MCTNVFANWDLIKSIACSQLPVASCESLKFENHKNTIKTINSKYLEKHCMTGNINRAKHIAELDSDCYKAYQIYKNHNLYKPYEYKKYDNNFDL